MLRRIPAVDWAFARLRPSPHSGNIEVAPIDRDASPAIIEDITSTDAAPIPEVSSAPVRDADFATGAPVPENDAAASVVAEKPFNDICVSDVLSSDRATEIETPATTPVAAEVLASSAEAENEPTAVSDLAIAADDEAPAGNCAEIDSVLAEEIVASSADGATASTILPDVILEAVSSPEVSTDFESVVVETMPVLLVEADSVAVEANADSEPVLIVEIAQTSASDVPLTTAIAPETNEPAGVGEIEPAPAHEPPAPEMRNAPKVRARPAEPTDRTALIRQRWAETGIRMWNPRLHGTGEAALNIQGSIGLLPPAAGETMPRYDKLEFKMLGGQIVCEGVIVEAPAQPGNRSFTRLVEPRNTERVREPTRERQAVLA